jgi:hypothetical protein
MTPPEIQAAYARTNEVINGFNNPSVQNSRDAVALVKHHDASSCNPKERDDFQAAKDIFGL